MVIVRVYFRTRQIPKCSMFSPRVRLLSSFGSACFEFSHRHMRIFEDFILESNERQREDIFPHVHLLAALCTFECARGFMLLFTKTFYRCIHLKGRAGFLARLPYSSRRSL